MHASSIENDTDQMLPDYMSRQTEMPVSSLIHSQYQADFQS